MAFKPFSLYDTTILLRQNIKQAIVDYGEYTYSTRILDNVSNAFIKRLAEDATYTKRNLRELFRQSSAWDEELQALVINGTKTHDPDYGRIENLVYRIIEPYLQDKTQDEIRLVRSAMRYFYLPEMDDEMQHRFIDSMNRIAPKAYRKNRKKSRIFKALCDALGLTDYTAGSEFQRLYAQLADELSAKKLDFKLFISINPAHFLTMSNPKNDNRGDMLTSCHSFNSDEYKYNNGCIGYARDNVTMIAFTVYDPSNPSSLNNRKTTRQLFMYKVGNGVLLQSRMYNTQGGVYGASELTPVYRDLVQKELSELEGVPNLWKTYTYCKNKPDDLIISPHPFFGGYPDWKYEDFDAKISIRLDHIDDFKNFEVGNYGLCIECGSENVEGLYCADCENDKKCENCGCRCDEDDLYAAYDRYNNMIEVCENCLDNYFAGCVHCRRYYPIDALTCVDEDYVCQDCMDAHYDECAECGAMELCADLQTAYDVNGCEVQVCESCLADNYYYCPDCGNYCHGDSMVTVYDHNGYEIDVCCDCAKNNYVLCAECDKKYYYDSVIDGLCPNCRRKADAEQETTA